MRALILPLLVLSTAAPAQPVMQSAPSPLPIERAVPAAKDVDYPGTIRLVVDATDVTRGIFKIRETIPVAGAGPLTLLYPAWLPGKHAARGPIAAVAGLKFSTGGTPVPWRRDPVDVYAFHLDVPAGATELIAEFDYVSSTKSDQDRVVMTQEMLNLQWNLTALYPAGWYTRRIPVAATAILPAGWRYGVALDPVDPAASGTVAFKPVSFETLVDSPMFAGRYFRQETLAPGVRLNMVADAPEMLAATPEQIAKHRALVSQAIKLFGSQHYDRYEFLLSITDRLGDIGLEHHRSSENGVVPGYFTDWDQLPHERNLLPHEFVHSWNGKYRRGADSFTPDFATPMRNSLLWVYEGQTQFWGYVLQARSGLVSKDDTLAAYAVIAAQLDGRPGRTWRPMIDTTNDPIMAARKPQPWTSWQRSEDYYNEGLLIWLDVDMTIRELTGGRKSLDDFARGFFGPGDRDWGVSTYTLDDVVAGLNAVVRNDWAEFLRARVDRPQPRAPLGWLAKGGYRLVFGDEPTGYWKALERARKMSDFSYSLGLTLGKEGQVAAVMWDSPAFAAGITIGTTLVAVNGRAVDGEVLKAAIKDAAASKRPIELILKKGDAFRTIAIPYQGGLRYPRLEKIAGATGWLDRLLEPRR